MSFDLAMDEDGDDDDEVPTENNMVNGHSETSKTKARVTYEEYKHMANLMVIHLRSEEEKEGIVQHKY